jgi:crotonobetainyl-CoA:carnitine CoA-transferase CaiB-like acyl-CoA transferase
VPSPLAHIRVIDLTDLRGALAGRILGDLGADVLMVEAPRAGVDRTRGDRSLPFLYRNANKRSVVLDLAERVGRERVAGLCDRADVLIENFGPEGEHRHGFTPAEISARHPHLVHVAMADFGLDGPRASWRAEPIVALAGSGALYPAGFPELPPCSLPGHLAHDCGSVYAIAGALTALLERAKSGRGQTVEVSVQEAALAGLNPWSIVLEDYARVFPALPTAPRRNADGPYIVLQVADGYVRVLPGNPKHWRSLVEWLGRPEALAGPEWEVALYRLANHDVIRMISAEALRGRSRKEALDEGRRLGFPIVPVNTPDEFVTEEQTRARGFFRETGFPHLEGAPFAPLPFNFSRTPVSIRRAAPTSADAAGEGDVSHFSNLGNVGFSAEAKLEKWETSPSLPAADAGTRGPVLKGIRVVGLTCGAVGPEACGLLGELGAEVIKIESRANLDFLRRVTFDDHPDHSWTFNDECRGQKSVCLDLATARGRELALRLCARADVVVENNRGGVVEEWGLDYEDVARVNPAVIYLCSQGFGRGGPLGRAPSFGPLNATFAGINWMWNHPEAPYPGGISLNYPDHIASKLGTVAVLAALEHRRRTGEGQRIEMAQTEAAAFLGGEFYLQGHVTGRPEAPRGNSADHAVPHGVYSCSGDDRWVAIAAMGDEAWQRLRAGLGWKEESRLTTLEGRLAARADIDRRVTEWTRTKSPEEAAAMLQAAGVSAMAVQDPNDHRADPHLAARGAIVAVEHPEIGRERHAANPIRLSRTPVRHAGAAPLLGADTGAVLSEVLGLSRAEIERLIADGTCR